MILRYRDRQYAAELISVLLLHFDFFSWLAKHGPATNAEIAAKFEIAERPLDVALTLCRANQFISSRGDRSEITRYGQEHLVKGSPWYLGPYYQPIADTPIVQSYLKVLKSGKPGHWQAKDETDDWHASMMDEDFARDFTALMNCRGISFGQVLATALTPWIRDRKSVLDVGGGSGIYSSTLIARHPQLTATVLEQPPVDNIARTEITKHGLEDKIHIHSGNMFKDPWPGQADILLLSNVLHDWDLPEVELLIKKSADYLKKDGLLVIHEAFLSNDKSGPLPVAEYSALLMNITQGKCYTPDEYGSLLESNDFSVGAYHDTIADRGFMTAIKR